MNDLRLLIKISADGQSAKAELSSIDGSLAQLGRTAQGAGQQMDRGFIYRSTRGRIDQSGLATARNLFIAYHAVAKAADVANRITQEADTWDVSPGLIAGSGLKPMRGKCPAACEIEPRVWEIIPQRLPGQSGQAQQIDDPEQDGQADQRVAGDHPVGAAEQEAERHTNES